MGLAGRGMQCNDTSHKSLRQTVHWLGRKAWLNCWGRWIMSPMKQQHQESAECNDASRKSLRQTVHGLLKGWGHILGEGSILAC